MLKGIKWAAEVSTLYERLEGNQQVVFFWWASGADGERGAAVHGDGVSVLGIVVEGEWWGLDKVGGVKGRVGQPVGVRTWFADAREGDSGVDAEAWLVSGDGLPDAALGSDRTGFVVVVSCRGVSVGRDHGQTLAEESLGDINTAVEDDAGSCTATGSERIGIQRDVLIFEERSHEGVGTLAAGGEMFD